MTFASALPAILFGPAIAVPWDRRLACPAQPWDRRLACPALPCHKRDADERAVLKQTIAADRCFISNRSHPSNEKVCIPSLISTGETPNRPMEQMAWPSMIGLARLEEI